MPGNATRKTPPLTGTPAPWLDWEGDEADRTIRFIETYCRLPDWDYEPMVVADYQADEIRAWLDTDNPVSAAILSVARGNGKSTFVAAFVVARLFLTRHKPIIYVVAVSLQQAREVYGTASEMIEAEPELDGRAIVYTAINDPRVTTPFNGGQLKPRSADVAGLQGLKATLVVVDEVGFVGMDAWNAIVQGTGKRRGQLVVGIGTTGVQTSALWAITRRWQKEGRRPGKRERFSWYTAEPGGELDDPDDLVAANPLLADDRIDTAELAAVIDAERHRLPETQYRRYRRNEWAQDAGQSWLGHTGPGLFDSLHDPAAELRLLNQATFVALDVSKQLDCTAVVAGQELEPGVLTVVGRIWAPPRGTEVRQADVRDHLRRLAATMNVRAIAYDPMYFVGSAQELEEDGLPMVEFPQSPKRMTPAVMGTLDTLTNRELVHGWVDLIEDTGADPVDGREAFRSHVLSAAPKTNAAGFTLQKGADGLHIDAAVALAMCVQTWLTLRNDRTDEGLEAFLELNR